jgi:hypothetical protein
MLRVFLTELGKSATITRKISSPTKPKIEPADDDVKAALAEIAEHREITLSRREILRFILVEPSKRSEEIQTILKLDEIGQTRSTLNTAQNKLQSAHKITIAQVRSSRDALQLHLQIASVGTEDLLQAVNTRRGLLSLPELVDFTLMDQLKEIGKKLNDLTVFLETNMVTKQELKDLREELPTREDFSQLQTSVDGIAKQFTDRKDEKVISASRSERMEAWIVKAAKKLGVEYKP